MEANKLVLGNLPLGWVHPLGVRSVASAQLWRRWLRHWLITASCRPGGPGESREKIDHINDMKRYENYVDFNDVFRNL